MLFSVEKTELKTEKETSPMETNETEQEQQQKLNRGI